MAKDIKSSLFITDTATDNSNVVLDMRIMIGKEQEISSIDLKNLLCSMVDVGMGKGKNSNEVYNDRLKNRGHKHAKRNNKSSSFK